MTFSASVYAQQKYKMDVEFKDGTITSYLMSSVRDVKYEGTKTVINVKGQNTYTTRVFNNEDIVSIAWDEYDGWIAPTGTGQHHLDEQHVAVVTPDYSIKFDAPCIEGDMTLDVNKRNNMPPAIIDEDMDISPAIAYDFDLQGIHELNSTVEIRLPIKTGPDEIPMAAYYNEDTHKWQPVNHYYDEATGELVIRTSHLTTYGGFIISNAMSAAAKLIFCYIPFASDNDFYKFGDDLMRICYSDNQLASAMDTYANQYSSATQWGCDIGSNAFQALNVRSELLEDFSEALGWIGVAVSVYQIIRSDYEDDGPQVAGQTLKLCLSQVNYWASKIMGNAILNGSMASVAFIDYALNKFAEEAWNGRKDLYKKGYELYYSRGERGYRNAVDWFNEFWPLFQRKDLSEQQINDMIDEKVNEYVRRFWQNDIMSEYYTKANNGVSWTYLGGLSQALMDELSNEHRGNLYNGTLISVFKAIKNKLENQAFDLAQAEMEKYVDIVNKVVVLNIMDSNLEDGKSTYAGYTVRLKDVSDKVTDKERWQTLLKEDGTGTFRYRLFAMHEAGAKPILQVIDKEENLVLEIPLSELNAGNTIATASNIIDISEYAENEIIREDSYTIKMTPFFQHVDFKMAGWYDADGETRYQTVNEPTEQDGIYYQLWYDDIKEAIAEHQKNVKPTNDGNIRYVAPDSALVMNGTYDFINKVGSGTFKMRTSGHKIHKTEEQFLEIFSSFNSWIDYLAAEESELGFDFASNDNKPSYNLLLEGDIEHRIDGTFTVTFVDGKFVYTLNGNGTYKIEATACNEILNPKCILSGAYIPLFDGTMSMTTTDISAEGNVQMECKFRIRR